MVAGPSVTCNVEVIHGGTRPNVVAEAVTLEVDVRSSTRADLQAAEREWGAIAAANSYVPDVTTTVEEMGRHWPMEKRLLRRAWWIRRSISPSLGFRVRDASTGGGRTPTRLPAWACPRSTGWVPSVVTTTPPGEYLEVDSIAPRTTLLALLLLAIARDVVGGWD